MPSTTTQVVIEEFLQVTDGAGKVWKHSYPKRTFKRTTKKPHNVSHVWTGEVTLAAEGSHAAASLDLTALPTDGDDLDLTGLAIRIIQIYYDGATTGDVLKIGMFPGVANPATAYDAIGGDILCTANDTALKVMTYATSAVSATRKTLSFYTTSGGDADTFQVRIAAGAN